MKILMINVVCGIRSTGRICTDLAVELEKQGHEVKIAYGREHVPEQFQKYAVKVGTDLDVYTHALKARLFDSAGFESKRVTKKFVEWIKEYDPDVIHLHNLHGYYINVETLFQYLKRCKKRIIWTLHDCWAFTGHCTHFEYIDCNKWMFGCDKCPQKKEYPGSYIKDCSRYNFFKKKRIFDDIPNMILVTPSEWLRGLVKHSFLKKYIVEVIHNGIDTSVFKPTKSDIRTKYCIQGKKIILGVASTWSKKKGLDAFNYLARELPRDYQIILVGLDKKQIGKIEPNIIGISRTNNVNELAALYTIADVFVNPTLEDTYPTVNLEAIACGTPVVTYNSGGSPESACLYGNVIAKGDCEELLKAIIHKDSIKMKVTHLNVDYRNTVLQYMELYQEHIF